MGRGKQRTRGASEPGEYSTTGNTGSGKAEVISPLVLHYISTVPCPVGADNCVYQGAPERETEARLSVKGAQRDQAASNLWPSQVAENRSQQEDTAI